MSTETYFPDLNTLFARVLDAGIACDQQVRVTICDQTWPKIGIKVTVLVDYRPNCKPTSEAGLYAIAAVVLFEGLSLREYRNYCDSARARMPVHAGGDLRQRAAEGLAAKQLISDSRAVCVYRDEMVMEQLRQAGNARYQPFDADAINLLGSMPVFSAQRDLRCVHGPVDAQALQHAINSILAKDMTCVSESRLESWVAEGPHKSRAPRAA